MWKHRATIIILTFLVISSGFMLGKYLVFHEGIDLSRIFLSAQEEKVESFRSEQTSAAAQENQNGIFPRKVAGMTMERLVTGTEALQNIGRMLGADITIKRAYIPSYRNNDDQLIIWIVELSSAREAQNILEMINRQREESDAFYNYHELSYEGQEIYFTECTAEMDHYYYSKGNWIYWVTIAADDTEPVFYEVYQKF